MIYYRLFWDTKKNFGRAINQEVNMIAGELLPGDWICLLDGDAIFLTDFWGKQIEDIIHQHGTYYDVIGGMLSRCNVPDQLLDSKISDNYNLIFHREIALDRQSRFYTDIKETRGPVAAACMLFKYSAWKKAGGFQENTVHFDSLFCQAVRQKGGKLAIAQGLYLSHLYRPNVFNPGANYNHLI